MPDEKTGQLYDAVDDLLAHSATLPPAAERKRLRMAHGLTQDDVATALRVRRATVAGWESDNPQTRTEPRGPVRKAYARLLDKLAELYPPAADPASAPTPVPPAQAAAAPAPRTGPPRPARTPSRTSAAKRPAAAVKPARPPAADTKAVSEQFPAGPLAVLDGDTTAHLADGRTVSCPAATIVQLVQWALEAGLGAERLHHYGDDADPLVVLTAAAADHLGLPPQLEDRRVEGGLRLDQNHPVVREVLSAGWQLTRRGFGPWPRIYRPAERGRRQCVQLAILGWEALEERAWPGADELPPKDLASMLGTYASRVITPRGSTAVNGLELMTALRPPTRPVRADAGWTSAPVRGSLTGAVEPAPPEAPEEHPAAAGRGEGEALDEEAYEWVRDPELLDDAEVAGRPYVIGLDVNMAFAAAANRLYVGLGAPVFTDGPRFDKTIPGCWYADLSHVVLDPRLPSPFTPSGEPPTGPAWYATPTLAYAEELGHRVLPLRAYLRPESGAYLDRWYERLRDAYLATMADLGVTKDQDEAAYLQAMARHKDADPAAAAVLSAIKATVKGGVGKLRERAQGRAKFTPGQRWPAVERPTWRPDIRAALISTARVNMHRKMARMAEAGLYPLAVLSDCVVYPAATPSPLDLLPRIPDGKPAPGTFRLGVSPGMVKLEGVRDFYWAAELMEQNFNPARHIKDDTRDPEE